MRLTNLNSTSCQLWFNFTSIDSDFILLTDKVLAPMPTPLIFSQPHKVTLVEEYKKHSCRKTASIRVYGV